MDRKYKPISKKNLRKIQTFYGGDIYTDRLYNGLHYTIVFRNGYGASVVKHDFSTGGPKDLFEVAVLDIDENGAFTLNFDTPITDDSIGGLEEDELMDVLADIAYL